MRNRVIVAAVSVLLFAWSSPRPAVYAQGPDAYRAGVQAYLDGNNEGAISYLQEAIRRAQSEEKAKQLLVRVYLRTIKEATDKKEEARRKSLILQATKLFPHHPEVQALFLSVGSATSSVGEKKDAPAAASNPRPTPREHAVVDPPAMSPPAASRRKDAAVEQTARAATSNEKKASRPASVEEPRKNNFKTGPATASDPTHLLETARSYWWVWIPVIATLLGFFFFLFAWQGRRAISEQMRSVQDALRKELEMKNELQKQALELEQLRRTEEEKIRLEIEARRRQEETRLQQELAEKRRQEEERLKRNLETRIIAPVSPSPVPRPAPSIPTPRSANEKWKKSFIRHQQEKIMEIAVDISPPERRQTWDRIADQVFDLHQSSPEAAYQFLLKLAYDENVWTRASILAALARVRSPETLEMLLNFHSDPDPEIQREALRQIKQLRQYDETVPEPFRQKIIELLEAEKNKGEWII